MNNVQKLPGVDYVAENWALAMMLKEQTMTSVKKTLKTLV